MTGIIVLYIVYAVVLLGGGAIGYARAKSMPSLVAGIVSGVLAVGAAGLLSLHHPRSGLGLGIMLSLAMAIFFFGRFQQTRKAMPAVPVIVLSVLVLIVSLARLATGAAHHA